MDFKTCSKVSNDHNITVEENRRKFTLKNQGGEFVRKVQVDGCLIVDARIRCDYLFEIGKKCHCAVYVELKGSDIQKAFSQLLATVGYVGYRHKNSRVICQIVASRVPRAGTSIQNLKLKMARKHNALLLVGTSQVVVDLQSPLYGESSCNPP
jgi:hypothetical protein